MAKAQASWIKYGQLAGFEIRILVLKPGLPEDKLVVELETVDLARYDQGPDYEADAYNPLPPQRIRTGPTPAPPPVQKLNHTPSDEPSPFEAISYVWGEPNFCRDLWTLDGHHLGITESLFEALIQLRYANKTRRLWADAVCINQQDVKERSAQVAMMGRIYKSCAKVQICLDSHSSPNLLVSGAETFVFAALNHCDTIYKQASSQGVLNVDIVAELAAAVRERPYCGCCGCEIDADYLSLETVERGLQLACSLLGHVWFTRVWVVQEVALATVAQLRHGRHHASWQAFEETISHFSRLSRPHVFPAGRTFDIAQRVKDLHILGMYRRSYARDYFKPDDLITSLVNLAGRNCRDTRDRIYALRALLGLEQEGLLKPDYECSDATVYRDTVLLCLSRMGHARDQLPRVTLLLVLSSTQDIDARPAELKHLPSWVPDLGNLKSQTGNQHTLQKIEAYKTPSCYQFYGSYRRLLFPFQHIWTGSKPDILALQGQRVGIVRDKLLEAMPSRVGWSKMSAPARRRYCHDLVGWITSFRSVVSSANLSMPAHLVDITVRELLCCGDYGTGTGSGGIDLEGFARCFDNRDDSVGKSTASSSLMDELDLTNWWRILRLFLVERPRPFDFQRSLWSVEMRNRVSESQASASTEVSQPSSSKAPSSANIQPETRYGWIPSGACPGDTLLYIPSAPFLLVQHASSHLKGRLSGDAWIQGIDEKEILEPSDTMDWIELR